MMDNTAVQIAERLEDIDREMASMRLRMEMLTSERSDLLTAQKVIKRFSENEDGNAGLISNVVQIWNEPAQKERKKKSPTSKPAGTPTLNDMVLMAAEAFSAGDLDKGGSPQQICELIQSRWWPSAPADSVRSTVWRQWKAGHLIKVGSNYRLPHHVFLFEPKSPEGGAQKETAVAPAKELTAEDLM